jgi:amino acid transporter
VQTAAQAGLALPEKPSNDWLLAATIGFWAMAILAALITVVYIASGLVGGTWLELLLPGAGFGSVTVLTVLAGLAIYMPFLAVVIGVPWFIRRHLARKDAEEQAAWKRMQQAWGRLRYCTACIGVFLLDRRRLVPLGQVETLFV